MNVLEGVIEIVRVNARRMCGRPRAVPKRLVLQVTNLCNSRCTTCHIWKLYRHDPAGLQKELSADEWIQVASDAIRSGVRQIEVTGGEPFLKEGVPELLKVLVSRLDSVSIVTNALCPEAVARDVETILRFARPGGQFTVSVSLDGLGASHDKIRGVIGSFDKAVDLLKRLNALSVQIPQLRHQISFTLSSANASQLSETVDYVMNEGLIPSIDKFCFRCAQSSARYHCTNALGEKSEILDALQAMRRRYKLALSRLYISGIMAHLAAPQRLPVPCYGLFASCWVGPYGNVTPCLSMTDSVIGNVRSSDYDILPAWRSPRAAELRKTIARGKCPVCWTDCQAYESLYYSCLRRPLWSARVVAQKLLGRS